MSGIKQWIGAWVLFCSSMCACLTSLHAQEADLEKIQSALKSTKAQLLQKEQRRSAIYSELKVQEENIADTAKALNSTRIQLIQNKVKFMFSEKATKIEEIFTVDLTLTK